VPGLVVLDGSSSSDPDGDALTFEWSLGGNILGAGATLTASLPWAQMRFVLKVSDPCGASNLTSVLVTVIDTTPPVITSVPGPIRFPLTTIAWALFPIRSLQSRRRTVAPLLTNSHDANPQRNPARKGVNTAFMPDWLAGVQPSVAVTATSVWEQRPGNCCQRKP